MSGSKWYVTMTDTFLSGWGNADNKKAKFIYTCDSLVEAEIVKDNAERRGDQKYINIRSTKPYYNSRTTLSKWKTKEDSKRWYIDGAF